MVFLPGATTEYLESPCIAVPLKKDGLPADMKTRNGQSVSVNWDDGDVWEVVEDVRFAPANQKGGTLLLLYVER